MNKVKSKVNYKDKRGVSPIYYALMAKDTQLLEILVVLARRHQQLQTV